MSRKKNRVSKLSDSDEEYFVGKALKIRKLAVDGKPDHTDKANLELLFQTYDRTNGGRLKRFCDQLAVERALNNKIVMKSVSSDNIAFAMPQDLQLFMEKYFPTIWTNQEHARWFIKTFPVFRR